MQINLRIAVPADVDAIVELVNQAYRPAATTAGWTHEMELVAGDRIRPAQVLSMLKPDSFILLLTHKSTIVSCVQVAHNEKNSTTEISMLATSPTKQARGLGKCMLEHAEQYARKYFRCEAFQLSVLSARPELIAFYERRGYLRNGEVMDYPVHAGVGQPRVTGLQVITLTKTAKALLDTRTIT